MTNTRDQIDAARDKWIDDSTDAFRDILQIVFRAGCEPVPNGDLDHIVDCVRSVVDENERLKTRLARISYSARQTGFNGSDDPESLATWFRTLQNDKLEFAERLRQLAQERSRDRERLNHYRETVDRMRTTIGENLFKIRPNWVHLGDPADDLSTLIRAFWSELDAVRERANERIAELEEENYMFVNAQTLPVVRTIDDIFRHAQKHGFKMEPGADNAERLKQWIRDLSTNFRRATKIARQAIRERDEWKATAEDANEATAELHWLLDTARDERDDAIEHASAWKETAERRMRLVNEGLSVLRSVNRVFGLFRYYVEGGNDNA